MGRGLTYYYQYSSGPLERPAMAKDAAERRRGAVRWRCRVALLRIASAAAPFENCEASKSVRPAAALKDQFGAMRSGSGRAKIDAEAQQAHT